MMVLTGRQNMLALCETLIAKAGEPQRVRQMIEASDAAGITLPTSAMWPGNVMAKYLSLDVRDNPQSRFERVAPGRYGLRCGI